MPSIKVGEKVKWKWGNGEGTGKVVERYTEDVTVTIKGTQVKRNASEEDPAFLIEQDDGDRVLKGASELSSTSDS